jgi:lipopolysaccharide biosynthesis protein
MRNRRFKASFISFLKPLSTIKTWNFILTYSKSQAFHYIYDISSNFARVINRSTVNPFVARKMYCEVTSIFTIMISKKSLCVFIHFSEYPYIPNYVVLYVNELSVYFDEVIMVCNIRTLTNRSENLKKNVSAVFVENVGYDLGKFYNVFKTIKPDEYDQIACINDSNVLFNKLSPIFKWSESQQFDFWGTIDSYEKPWFSTHQDNYHIQSHFMVFNRKAIEKLPEFFDTLGMDSFFEEKDITKLRQTVINNWEIGLTQFLIGQGLTHGSFIDSKIYSLNYLSGKTTNVGHELYAELIESGYPLIKRKIIAKSNWKDNFRAQNHWETMIRKFGNQDWKIEELIDELVQIKNDTGNQTIHNFKRKLLNSYNSLFNKEVA